MCDSALWGFMSHQSRTKPSLALPHPWLSLVLWPKQRSGTFPSGNLQGWALGRACSDVSGSPELLHFLLVGFLTAAQHWGGELKILELVSGDCKDFTNPGGHRGDQEQPGSADGICHIPIWWEPRAGLCPGGEKATGSIFLLWQLRTDSGGGEQRGKGRNWCKSLELRKNHLGSKWNHPHVLTASLQHSPALC